MGIVYEAVDTQHGGPVALKLLHDAGAASIYHLKREFRSLIDVKHPNLVQLHELFSDGDQWFFTMDLISGTPLTAGLGANADEHSIRDAFSQLAVGIRAIHRAGKLHRDLKPSNVMLSEDGRVTVLDYGLATDQENIEAAPITKILGILGTPLYMAPEQAIRKDSTEASDWYAFGVMLFEALTGSTPFTGSLTTIILNKRFKDAPPVSSLRRDVSTDLDSLCAQLLRRDPGHRAGYAHIAEVLGKPVDKAPTRRRQGSVPFVGRNEEMAKLLEVFRAVEKGEPAVAMVRGTSGIGKSALAGQFLHRLQMTSRAVVLASRCYEQESVPYKACDSLMDRLSHYLNHLPEKQVTHLLPHNIRSLGSMFPVIERLEAVKKTKTHHPLPTDLSERRVLAVEALKELLSRIAKREPVVLFVDDLQWSDEDGAKLLSSLFARPAIPPIFLLVAFRDEETGGNQGLELFLHRLSRFDGVAICDINLKELKTDDAQRLATELLPPAHRNHASTVARESGGSPFFITEISRSPAVALSQVGQLTLEEAIAKRMEQLSLIDKDILEAICISDEPVEQNLLKIIVDKGDIAPGLRRLRDKNYIIYVTGPTRAIRAYHDKIRESVISRMGAARLRQWHQRFVDVLEKEDPSNALWLTDHLRGAGQTEKAGISAALAADQAYASMAFEQAIRLYTLALESGPGDPETKRPLQIKLANALAHAGHGSSSAFTYLLAAMGVSAKEKVTLYQLAATQLITTGHFEQGMEVLNNVLLAAGVKPYKTQAGIIASLIFHRTALKLSGLRFKKRDASELEERDNLLLEAYKSAWQGFSLAEPLHSSAYMTRYFRLALRLGKANDLVLGLASETTQLSVRGPRNKAIIDDYFNLALKICPVVDDPRVLGYLNFAMANSAWFLGNLKDAPEHLRISENIYLQDCQSATWELTVLNTIRGLVRCWLGNWGALQRDWDTWCKGAEERHDLFSLTVLRLWPMGAFRWLAADRPDKVWKLLTIGLKESPTTGNDVLCAFASLANSYTNIYCGNYQDAFHPLEAKLRAFARTPTGKFSPLINIIMNYRLGYAALAHAMVRKDKTKMWKIAERYARRLTKDNSAMALAYVRVIRAATAHQKGDLETAVTHLDRAIQSFEDLEYKLYAATARRQLGRILGGEQGQAFINQADRIMEGEQIVNPERVAAMLAPGFFM